MIQLPPLPFAKDALSPHISAETLEYHYGKHHQAYVNNLNQLVPGTKYESLSLDEIVRSSEGKIFNNAAQVWNHTFYWSCLSPNAAGKPAGALLQRIERNFGSFEQFQKQFTETAVGLFGSGWAWLVVTADKKMAVGSTANQDSPLMGKAVAGFEGRPVIGLDVWEHAYYLHYQNRRPDYIAAWWAVVDWSAAEANYAAALK